MLRSHWSFVLAISQNVVKFLCGSQSSGEDWGPASRPGGRASPESGRIIALSFEESYCRTMRQVIDRHRTVEWSATIFRKLHARQENDGRELMMRRTRAVRLHAETRVRISLYSGRVRPRTRMQSSWITVVNFLREAIKAASFAADREKSIIWYFVRKA